MTPAVAIAPDHRRAEHNPQPSAPSGLRLAYIVNCFPNFIETMIYREVAGLRAIGERIATFSIRRPQPNEVTAEAARFVDETFYILPVSVVGLLATHVREFASAPLRYCRTLIEVLTATHQRHSDRLRTFCHFVEGVSLLPELRTRGIQHIHAHWAVGSATCAMVASRLSGIPFSFTAHAYDIWRDKLLLPEKLRAAAFAVTCTDYNRQHLARTYSVPLDKLHTIYHGVDVTRFEPAARTRHPEPRLLTVGRLVEQKGFDRLLQACAVLVRRGYRFRCDIVGDGPLREPLERLTQELALGGRVRFLGRKLQEELIPHYASADLFALPCIPASDDDRDGIPNTLIEAMAMEVPVVSTRFSGIPELVTHGVNGLLVEPGDVDELAGAIASLLDEPQEGRRMGQAGRRRVLSAFTIQQSARRLQTVFAGSRRSPTS